MALAPPPASDFGDADADIAAALRESTARCILFSTSETTFSAWMLCECEQGEIRKGRDKREAERVELDSLLKSPKRRKEKVWQRCKRE